MVAVKPLRALLRRTAPAKLYGRGGHRGFCRVRQGKRVGPMLAGLTRRLEERLHSNGTLPSITRRSRHPRRGGVFRGKNGGRRRGTAVDAQIGAIANGKAAPPRMWRLTRLALAALAAEKIRLVCGQRAVVAPRGRLATAVDLVGLTAENELVLIELKTGYDEGRLAPARRAGRALKMGGPLAKADDCLAHRHLAQLAATRAMFVADATLARELDTAGVQGVKGKLLYVTDDDVAMHDLEGWWADRGERIVAALT